MHFVTILQFVCLLVRRFVALRERRLGREIVVGLVLGQELVRSAGLQIFLDPPIGYLSHPHDGFLFAHTFFTLFCYVMLSTSTDSCGKCASLLACYSSRVAADAVWASRRLYWKVNKRPPTSMDQ